MTGRVFTEDDFAALFVALAHGKADHRRWLLEALERFLGASLPPDKVAPGLEEQAP